MTDNPKGLERALQVLKHSPDPSVIDFFGLAGMYGVDVQELAAEYFKWAVEEA